MPRLLALLLLCFGVTSCSVRIGAQLRPAAAAPIAPVLPSRPAVKVAHPRRFGRGSGPAGGSQPASRSASGTASLAQLCVDEINRYRATLGLRPLERASDREACADTQIGDDARSGRWHGRFGACGESAQNECNASPTDRTDMIKGCLRGMWAEGPGGGHYENMKSASASKVWCGFYTTPSGDVWSVQDYR